jgi:hypothetical protein
MIGLLLCSVILAATPCRAGYFFEYKNPLVQYTADLKEGNFEALYQEFLEPAYAMADFQTQFGSAFAESGEYLPGMREFVEYSLLQIEKTVRPNNEYENVFTKATDILKLPLPKDDTTETLFVRTSSNLPTF